MLLYSVVIRRRNEAILFFKCKVPFLNFSRRLKERFTDGSRPGTGPLKRPFTPDTFDTPEEGSRQKDVAEEKQPKLDDDQKSVASTSSTDTSSVGVGSVFLMKPPKNRIFCFDFLIFLRIGFTRFSGYMLDFPLVFRSIRKTVSSKCHYPQSKKMSLDQFLALHTSEDNESFNEIQEEQFRKFRVDKAWMFKENEQLSIEMKREELTLPSIEEQGR